MTSNSILKLYQEYLAVTDNPQAAATLVLAHVTRRPRRRTPHPDALLTVADAAAKLNVSPDVIYDLCANHRLPHVRVGCGRGVIRINPADLTKISRQLDMDPSLAAFRKHCRR